MTSYLLFQKMVKLILEQMSLSGLRILKKVALTGECKLKIDARFEDEGLCRVHMNSNLRMP
jgi:hypothetical protein